jgi:hypothetical protein
MQLGTEEELDLLWRVTGELGFSRDETAALGALVLRSIDETRRVHGGIARAYDTLENTGGRQVGLEPSIECSLTPATSV